MVVVNCLFEQFIAHGTVWVVRASSRVDRLPVFALLDEGLRTAAFVCQLLLQTDTVLFEVFAMILGHVLRQRHA